ncbi:MAG: hypothetical protein GX351_04865 [Peptococcaceae bacterium]|nr:hypothetical protein [Peptococcaceae bacterium]
MKQLFLEYLVLEFFLLIAFGASLLTQFQGIIFSSLILSVINYMNNVSSNFWYWEFLIIMFCIIGLILNYFFDRSNREFRLITITAGSSTILLGSLLVIPLIPGIVLWAAFIGLPIIFGIGNIPKTVLFQLIFKFIFSTGWIIIGNILY